MSCGQKVKKGGEDSKHCVAPYTLSQDVRIDGKKDRKREGREREREREKRVP